MKLLVIVALLVLLAGCTQVMTCQTYCESQPHIQCVGEWNITGTYPDCNCQYICTVIEPLDDLPDLSIGGLPELGSMPTTNTTISVGSTGIGDNPFPSQPDVS